MILNWRVPVALLIMLMALGITAQWFYWPKLPDRVATHFDVAGNPDDWMSKQSATIVSLVLAIGLPLLFYAVGLLIRIVPASTINIPRREYWLAPERRAESIVWVQGFLRWFSCAMAAFAVSLNHLRILLLLRFNGL